MAYFPFFIDIKDKRCLIVGGGTVALRKIEKIMPYEPSITVVSPRICEGIRAFEGITLIEREFAPGDIDNCFMAIGASDSAEVNSLVSRLCGERNILVNIVDDKEKCGFIFPALIKKNGISIGISSSGGSPVLAKFLKDKINGLIDERVLLAEKLLSQGRRKVISALDCEADRRTVFERLLDRVMNGEKSVDVDIDKMIEEIKNDDIKNRDKKKQACAFTGTDGLHKA
ncbi:MAG: bifunctional precorrin-2 dehydrogenase/sirohydrochlorin ferrochelatase [Oscillospiraceae bacterium]